MAALGNKARILLDLGDAFSKALAEGSVKRTRARFPSVLSSTLITGQARQDELLLNAQDPLLRPAEFTARTYPRTRSYAGAEAFVERVGTTAPEKARYAGALAAVFGSDRQLLGHTPSEELVEGLVRKAIMLLAADGASQIDLVLLVDPGLKGSVIEQFARRGSRPVHMELRSHRSQAVRVLDVELQPRLVDAPSCAHSALGSRATATATTLVVDIGYLRCKLYVLSPLGCERATEIDQLGIRDCVRLLLRDGQAIGLFEDEYAVILALEAHRDGTLEIRRRRFAVGRILGNAAADLSEALARRIEHTVVSLYERRGITCHHVVLAGGGVHLVGKELARRLNGLGLGLVPELVQHTDYWLLEGACPII
jgi:hypothetical protein